MQYILVASIITVACSVNAERKVGDEKSIINGVFLSATANLDKSNSSTSLPAVEKRVTDGDRSKNSLEDGITSQFNESAVTSKINGVLAQKTTIPSTIKPNSTLPIVNNNNTTIRNVFSANHTNTIITTPTNIQRIPINKVVNATVNSVIAATTSSTQITKVMQIKVVDTVDLKSKTEVNSGNESESVCYNTSQVNGIEYVTKLINMIEEKYGSTTEINNSKHKYNVNNEEGSPFTNNENVSENDSENESHDEDEIKNGNLEAINKTENNVFLKQLQGTGNQLTPTEKNPENLNIKEQENSSQSVNLINSLMSSNNLVPQSNGFALAGETDDLIKDIHQLANTLTSIITNVENEEAKLHESNAKVGTNPTYNISQINDDDDVGKSIADGDMLDFELFSIIYLRELYYCGLDTGDLSMLLLERSKGVMEALGLNKSSSK